MTETPGRGGGLKTLFGKTLFACRRLPVFLFLLAAALHAQETSALSPSQTILEMDIRTSTLSELAAWSRRNGLPEGGTAADLARRLRDHYGLPLEGQVMREGQRVITIESARTTEYFTIHAVDEEYARLSGEVVISLREGDAVHEIRAWDILFNRTRNILTASGGVEYRRVEGDTIETFRGDSITIDLDNWASVFLGGVSERAMAGEGTTYLFAGTVISRDEEEVTVLRNATISSAGEESLWSLTASRVWLLPGSDFAILNAVLRVGHIPVFYIPAFFFPADQMIIHPAIGSRTREGSFVNTTTWILGRPRTEGASESSLMTFLGAGDDMERVREGVFLRSTGTRAQPDAGPNLSLLVDFYTNLGAYIGTDLFLPARGLLGATNLSMGVGLSRTLVNVPNIGYTPFFPTFDGETDWNYSQFLFFRVPFRYRFVADGSISGRYGGLNWRIPFYSDPLIDSDFINYRATTMDWLNMIQQGAAMEQETTGTRNHLRDPVWELTGNLRPRFPDMRPFITNISIAPIRSSLSFRTIETRNLPSTDVMAHSPMRFFFAPNTATLYSVSATVTGTPLRLGGAGQAAGAVVAQPERENPLEGIGTPISPFAVPEEEPPPPSRDPIYNLVPPELAQRFDLPQFGNTSFNVDFNLSPSSGSTLRFDTREWNEFDDVDWNQVESVVTNFAGNARIGLNFRLIENFLTNTFTFTGSGHLRQFSYLNEDADEFTHGTEDPDVVAQRIAARRLQEYRQTHFTTSYTVDTILRPVHRHDVFGMSRIQHTLGGLAVRSEFVGDGENPEWELVYGDWTEERIDRHQLVGSINARIMDMNQVLSATAHLPPRESAYTANAEFNIWITRTTASWGIRFPEDGPSRQDPFNLTHVVTFRNFGNFTQTLRMDTEERELTHLASTLNITSWGLSAAFRMERLRPRVFTQDGPWGAWEDERDSEGNLVEPQLIPRDLQIQYRRRVEMSPRNNVVNNVLLDLNTRTIFDLREYTNSSFTFGISSRLETRFMSFRMGAESVNDEIFRYFRNWPGFRDANIPLPDGPQNNLFLDLINSFRFDDESLRRSSGFKIRNFTVGAERSFGDWTASLDWRMSPHLRRPPGERPQFEMGNRVTFLVQWIPISEFRTEIRYDTVEPPRWQVQGL